MTEEWANINCDCGKTIQLKSDYGNHMHNEHGQIFCKCGKLFDSDHEWTIHRPECGKSVGAIRASKPLMDHLATIGELELKSSKSIIIKLNQPIDENLIEKLKIIDDDPDYIINEGKLLVDYAKLSSRKKYHRKSKTGKSDSEKDDRKVPHRRHGLSFRY